MRVESGDIRYPHFSGDNQTDCTRPFFENGLGPRLVHAPLAGRPRKKWRRFMFAVMNFTIYRRDMQLEKNDRLMSVHTSATLKTLGGKIITFTCSSKKIRRRILMTMMMMMMTRIREFAFDRFLMWRTDGRHELVGHMYS